MRTVDEIERKEVDYMFIYQARAWDEKIEVEEYKITKETPKQYQCEEGYYCRRIDKSKLDKVDNYGYAYSLDKNKAVKILKDHIVQEIERLNLQIEKMKKQLKNEIE